MEKITKSEEEWKKILTPEQYEVMRQKETEPAFSCAWKNHKEGDYLCAACGLPLFHSSTKFDSGTGWPSYFSPIDGTRLIEKDDWTGGIPRTEVICARCDSHLGHVFPDGPSPASTRETTSSTQGRPTGKRYCINSIALKFKPDEK